MSNIDFTNLKWIKNIKRNKGREWAYFDQFDNDEFILHWSDRLRSTASKPRIDDLIVLFQNYKNQGVRITHIVKFIDTEVVIDNNNASYSHGRKVKIIYRSKHIRNPFNFKFQQISYGHAYELKHLVPTKTISRIKKEVIEIINADFSDQYRIIKDGDGYIINFPSNKLHDNPQEFRMPTKVLTLIGENGCGKSAILESIFNSTERSTDYRTIAFSSGQNELFSDIFDKIQKRNRESLFEFNEDNEIEFQDKTFENPINAFYFNYNWAKLLIFFASIFKNNGLVRNYLKSHNYVSYDEMGVDISTKLSLSLRVDWKYLHKMNIERNYEYRGKLSGFLNSRFHVKLTKFIENTYKRSYDFNSPILKRRVVLDSTIALRIFEEKNPNILFNFFWFGINNLNPNIELEGAKLKFKNLELKDLSDGEYQLLSIYALIDLFDDEKTVFLFDEIDSHLYFNNISLLWRTLNRLKSSVITTTHISDSILKNDFANIKLVHDGKIEHDLTLRELARRLTEVVGKAKFEFKLVSRIKNLVLIDNEDDWSIFKKLAEKKIEENTDEVFSKLIPIKRTSSYNNSSEAFGLGKLKFVKEFKDQINGSDLQTKNIFMICDRDKLSKNSINENQQVKIHSDYNEIKKFDGVRSHLLSWKRMEIENYLISVSMLTEKGIVQNLKDKFPRISLSVNDNLDNLADIEEFDAKALLHPYFKPDGFDEALLDGLISLIPNTEISEDIVTMYNYLKNNIAV